MDNLRETMRIAEKSLSVAILDGALPFEMARLGACAIWMAKRRH